MNWLLVIAGAAIGAPVRYLTDRVLKKHLPTEFPWPTFVVNIVGSFLLGVVATSVSPCWQIVIGTGFCGALTTYSTFAFEVVTLAEKRRFRDAIAYPILSVVIGLLAAWSGASLAR